MQLWPAIDIINEKPVRLYKGDYSQKTEYAHCFAELVETFSAFAHGIHVVDLDGAKAGRPVNLLAIEEICKLSKIPVEVGGGIRSTEDIQRLLNIGVSRIILGTSALKDPQFAMHALEIFGPERIVIGVDAKDGNVATHGWEKDSGANAEEFIEILQNKFGVQTIIFTDISTDGTLLGPPIATFDHLVQKFPKLDIIASGGVSCAEDFQSLEKTGVTGCIFGKAFYEGKVRAEELTSSPSSSGKR
jgi:phosphoribosylformimino-5-aminoimidazole carboxamide ribotide isomerase